MNKFNLQNINLFINYQNQQDCLSYEFFYAYDTFACELGWDIPETYFFYQSK